MDQSVRVVVDAQIRLATFADLPALATWSAQVKDTFAPALEGDDRVLLVAFANGRFPIAHLLVDLTGLLSHLLVLGGFRNQGLGTTLIAEAERLLRERQVGRVTLMVEKSNAAAIRLYERLGYVVRGESEEIWSELVLGSMQPVAHPSWVMSKPLS
jgi:ribosomal protein S18 acetylase RimI-like enzyme